VNNLDFLVLITLSFLPPILYAIWIRNTEKYNREKWKSIFFCFLWGATIAVIASIILELIFGFIIIQSFQDITIYTVIATVVIAPFVEEFIKPFALRLKVVKKELDELEDGLIYGAVAGLGFSATENLFYGYDSLSYGFLYFILLISIRSIGACLLHASATSWTGFGYGKHIMGRISFGRILPYFFVAVLLHAVYNSLFVFSRLGAAISIILALTFSISTIYMVRNKIKFLDQQNELLT